MTSKIVDKKRIEIAVVAFFVCMISGSLTGYFGLQSYSEWLTALSVIVFDTGMLILLVCLIYPFKWGEFWFSYILNRLGRIGWLRRFEISQHSEGAITLSLLLSIYNIYVYSVVGAGSYIFNDLTTVLYLVFVYSWVFISIHLHYNSLNNLSKLSKVISKAKKKFNDKIKITNSFNKISMGLFIVGIVVYVAVTTFWIDAQDNAVSNLSFYVLTTSDKPTFAMAFPLATLSFYSCKFAMGLVFGLFSVTGGLVLMTTISLLWLTSEEIEVTIDVYDPICLKPAEQLVNTLWLLTGAGLLFVPYITLLSSNFEASGYKAGANWLNYAGWTYIIFFAGIFLFSLAKFYTFASVAKDSTEKKIVAELKDALEPKVDKNKLIVAKAEMKLLQGFRSRPTLTTIFQLLQITAVIIVNMLIRVFGMQ